VIPVTAVAIKEVFVVLRQGGIVAHATETCYGFACDLRNPAAVKKLFVLKKRPVDQPVSALFSSMEEAKKFVEWNEKAEELAKKHLPGPLTLILPLRSDAPIRIYPTPLGAWSSSLAASLGIRLSSHPLAQELVTRFSSPLSTTSANIHGLANPYSAEDIAHQFTGQSIQPDLIIDSGSLPPTPPSKVIDLTDDGRIIRS
jgi:L-threonylcarbamoyladenylate synthase